MGCGLFDSGLAYNSCALIYIYFLLDRDIFLLFYSRFCFFLRYKQCQNTMFKGCLDILFCDIFANIIASLTCACITLTESLVEMFDASIGAGSVFMPFGGKYQLTPTQSMVAKLPVLKGKTDTVTMMSYGFNPYLSNWSPYHGAAYAVVESVAKIVAAGGDFSKIRFTFQEYFKRMTEDAKGWGEPMSALLGAYTAQIGFGLPSIGGKGCHVAGSFNDIHVPATLVSFAVDVAKQQDIITPEFKKSGNKIVKFDIARDAYDMPDYEQAKALYTAIHQLIQDNVVISAYTLGFGGVAAAVSKMPFYAGHRADCQQQDEDAKILGIDYAMHGMAVFSEDIQKENEGYFRKSEERLAREQRKLSHCVKGSNNYYRQKKRVALCHEKIRNQRKDFLHKLSYEMAEAYDVVAVEDIDMKAMSQCMHFGKSVMDNSYGKFRELLEYKLTWRGKKLVRVDRFFPSSKKCCKCGSVKKELKLSDRVYLCRCGNRIDRDLNAAINIREEARRMLLAG